MGWFDFLKRGGEKSSPTQSELNLEVLEQLKAHGDLGRVSRPVTHYAYPFEDGAASYGAIQKWLASNDFETRPAEIGGGIVFEHETAVATDAFNILTQSVSDYMQTANWEYDGWECQVVASGQFKEEQN